MWIYPLQESVNILNNVHFRHPLQCEEICLWMVCRHLEESVCAHLSKWPISAFWSQTMIAQEQGRKFRKKAEVCSMDTVSRIKKLFLLSKHYIFTSIACCSYHFFQEEQLSLCSQQCTFFWLLKCLINRQPNGAPLGKKTWWFSSRKGEKWVFILASTVCSYFHIH